MLTINDNRNADPPTILIKDGEEVVLRYNWAEGSTLDHAGEVIQQRLSEMGQEDIAGVLADQVKKL